MPLKLWIFALLLLPGLAVAQVDVRDDQPREYIVQPGDTLWDISAVFLEDPWKWPEIWHVNPEIDNPHLIYPGDVIRLVYVDGEPRLELTRGESGRIKLSPQVRTKAPGDAIESIPLDTVREFFSSSRILDEESIEAAPHVVSGPEGRIMVGAGDFLYARGSFPEETRVYQIYRPGDEYVDPQSGEVLGLRADVMGAARMQEVTGEVGKLEVYQSNSEINLGDILLPLEQNELDPMIFPSEPEESVDGQIMAVDGGVSHIGQLDVVAINRGQDASLKVGDVLQVLQAGEKIRDRVEGDRVQLPDEEAGVLMIFKVLDRMSFGLILGSERTMAVGDRVTSP